MKLGSIVLGVLLSLGVSCGKDDSADETSSTTTYTFDANINPILKTSCAGSGCHSAGEANPNYVGSKAAFVADSTKVLDRIARSDSLIMPPATSGTLSSTDKQKIKDYLSQQSKD